MKKLCIFLVVALLALPISACASTSATDTSSISEAATSAPIVSSSPKTLTSVSSQTEAPKPVLAEGQYYYDIATDHWASEPINGFAAQGIYFQSDMGAKLFRPNDNMTRASVVYGLGKIAEAKIEAAEAEDLPFEDLDAENECTPYILWAYSNQVINGTSESTFAPDDSITRQDMMTILGRYLKKQNLAIPSTEGTTTAFTDADQISDYAKDYVLSMQKSGIINGYPDGSFGPKNPVSRAEAAQILWNFAEALKNAYTPEPEPTPEPTPTPTPEPTTEPTSTPTPDPTPTSEPEPTQEKPAETIASSGFLSKEVYADIKPYAESLGYSCDSYRDPVRNGWTLAFMKGLTDIVMGIYPEDDGYWEYSAIKEYGKGDFENGRLYNLDEMKSLLERYAN